MASPLTNLKLSLRLDDETYNDGATRKVMLETFPPRIRPNASAKYFLSDPSIQYIVLVVFVGVSWGLKKVLGPPLDELGNYLRDSVRVCMERRRRVPRAIGNHILWADKEVRVSIDTRSLMKWKDARLHFQKLDEYLAHGLGDAPSKDALWIGVRWDPDLQRWIFTQITCRHGSAFDYYIFDPNLNKWIGKNEV